MSLPKHFSQPITSRIAGLIYSEIEFVRNHDSCEGPITGHIYRLELFVSPDLDEVLPFRRLDNYSSLIRLSLEDRETQACKD